MVFYRGALLALVVAPAAAFAPASAPFASKLAASRVAVAPVMAEPSPKAVTIGAAVAGGLLGIQLSGEVSTGLLFATVLAYGTTLSNGFGEASKTLGSASSKVYSKTLELNEQYDLLPKAKSAIDTTVTVAGNLDANYGITSKIDEQLKLSQAVDSLSSKVDEVKSSVTTKVADLKAKASSE